ncbi:MAG TPA: hypothetical protein VLW44_01110 [Streptosporangiaceae bacterium]|nr:hypothetical protein [Streptosporangiaceae bacterium]
MDPARGHSPWRRGVRGEQQVLICPTCQGMHDWKADLDQCSRCGSVRLMRRLGEVECRDCGFVAAPESGAVPELAAVPEKAGVGAVRDDGIAGLAVMSGAEAPGLSEEVARALDRVLGRGPVGR